jgi:hypothetical protein
MLTVKLKARDVLTWERNIKTDLKAIRCEVVVWIYLAQDMVLWPFPVNTVVNFI